ncbi:MAG: hypothetical protein HC769_31530 [Cyanobacteria bacterium CRU_2_1]|nr:hypothetical protein [Cyanobacteria bacterium CRU_2_1]
MNSTSQKLATTASRNQQPMAVLGSHSQLLPAGFDGGNGAVKLCLDIAGNPVSQRIPAYLLPVHSSVYDVPDHGFVTYISGDRSDLVGQCWIAGMSAYQQNPAGYSRVVDGQRSKIDFGLQLLLGALSHLSERDFWHLSVVASIHDAQVFGVDLKQALQGRHRVTFGNSPTVADVWIDVVAVLEEGAGAIAHCRGINVISSNGQTTVFDFGSGTVTTSVFGAKGNLIDRKVAMGGVERLIDAIARNIETRRQLGSEGDRQIIRAGIENRSLEYGSTAWSFREIYEAELKPWCSSVLAPAIKAASPWLATSSNVIAIGGGAQLPTISELLTRKGIKPVLDPAWANAKGMCLISRLKSEA